jgi:hypothetical protein
MSQLGSSTDFDLRNRQVRFAADNGHCQLDQQCPFSAKTGSEAAAYFNIGALTG